MKKLVLFIFLASIISTSFFVLQSCKKDSEDPPVEVHELTFSIPGVEFKHDTYYSIEDNVGHLDIVFNEDIDINSVDGNILLYDMAGVLTDSIFIEVAGPKLYVRFKPDFSLKPGWRYMLEISQGFMSTSGDDLPTDTIIEFRTKTRLLSDMISELKTTTSQRTLIACISDLHMGQQKAVDSRYCWFVDNKVAMEQFLDMIIEKPVFKELVIMGDIFDEWIIPYSISPFDSAYGVTNTREYFESIANAQDNLLIIDKLKSIALNPDIILTYLPGNHDMRLTEEIFTAIIPNSQWKSDAVGLGSYSPTKSIVLEHGHRYDFINCPEPLVNNGHILPPGFFISRLYAQGYMTQGPPNKSSIQSNSSFEFDVAWDIALYELDNKYFSMNTNMDDKIIIMGGVDNYTESFSYNGAKAMFSNNIEEEWTNTQIQNKVPVPIMVAEAIGASLSLFDLYNIAEKEYMMESSPEKYKIVAFGHTHKAILDVYKSDSKIVGIYANSGTWINQDCNGSNPTRTFLTIYPADWSTSELDIVTYYQFNFNTTQNKYAPVRIKEESILN
ncbi:MAG: metallophosphoesterase [Bacteroidota bacterium]